MNNNKNMNWTNDKVIEFVNWYIDLHKLPINYKLENQEIIDSFLRGDSVKLWHEDKIENAKQHI